MARTPLSITGSRSRLLNSRGAGIAQYDLSSVCPKRKTNEQVDAIHHMILDHRQVTDQQITKTTDISDGSVHTIFILGMSKQSATWVP